MDVDDLAARVAAGDRRALARGITLVESTRADDVAVARALLDRLQPRTGHAVRLGLSGTPGVGKSTFVEALGKKLLDGDPQLQLAVLAIDPSSPVSGGSILGDKTRMDALATHPRAFVRPSPSGGALGGVAARTREALLLCEAAGCGVVVVETVGVGQSEHAVQSLTDTFVLLLAPGGGDDLQGQKRGVLDLVDVVVVNKADGPRVREAEQTAAHYRNAGHLLHALKGDGGKGWQPPVILASAVEGAGVDDVWAAVLAHRASLGASLAERRAGQADRWRWRCLVEVLLRRGTAQPAVQEKLRTVVDEVRAGALSPGRGAQAVVDVLWPPKGDGSG
jgi:LAO/AO transport system kinase